LLKSLIFFNPISSKRWATIQDGEKISRIFTEAKNISEHNLPYLSNKNNIELKVTALGYVEISPLSDRTCVIEILGILRFQFIRAEEAREYSRGRAGPARRGEAKRNGRRVARAGSAAKRKGEARAQRTMNSRGSRQLPSPGNVPTWPLPAGAASTPSSTHAHVQTYTPTPAASCHRPAYACTSVSYTRIICTYVSRW